MSLAALFVFLFGLVVGSFLNAVIYRLEAGDNPLRGRSYCPQCKHQLSWQDLIPVVSFLLLRGKCRYCEKPISWQYPLVELGTGLILVSVFWHLGFGFDLAFGIWHLAFFELLYLWVIASLLIVLFVYDLRHYVLPDRIVFPAIGIVILYQMANSVIQNWSLIQNSKFEIQNFGVLANPLLSGIGAVSFFLMIFLLSRGRAMGFGDVKLAFFMGLFLGWPNILVALFVAFLAGALVGITLIALRKKKLKSEIPFGPFLIAGTLVALFWGNALAQWYRMFAGF